jgi:hypothetical protein
MPLNVRFGSLADIVTSPRHVRFSPNNGHWAAHSNERHNRIPDGPSVGQPFRLLEFQRDIIREIYGDPAYWQAVDAVLKKRRVA